MLLLCGTFLVYCHPWMLQTRKVIQLAHEGTTWEEQCPYENLATTTMVNYGMYSLLSSLVPEYGRRKGATLRSDEKAEM